MKYGREDKRTGIGLSRDCYAEQFADPGDIKFNYMVTMHGDVLLEGEDPKVLADEVTQVIQRLHLVADSLRRALTQKATR